MRSSKEQGCASWEHCNIICRGLFCSSTDTCGVSSVELPFFRELLCFAASIPCAQTVEVSPRGPWTVVTLRHSIAYVCFITSLFHHLLHLMTFSGRMQVVRLTGSTVYTSCVRELESNQTESGSLWLIVYYSPL